jgi:hypothetical protein
MAYVDPTELTNYLRSTIVADEVEIEMALGAAESAINSMCHRTFTVPTAASTRTFVSTDTYGLVVPDIASTADLVIVNNGATLTAADYQLEISPGVPGPVGVDGRTWPYSRIIRLSGWWHVPTDGKATVSITARWGWPAVPDEVKLATKLLARDYLLARDTGFGIVQVGDFSRRVAGNGVVSDLLAPLRRAESFGIA